jgi:D-aspartate ligase
VTTVQSDSGTRVRVRRSGRTGGGGVVVLGTDYRALGVVRSLGRHGVPVWVIRQGDDRLGALSRYAQRRLVLPEGSPEAQVNFLVTLVEEHGLDGWGLMPTADETVALLSRYRDRLAGSFRVAVDAWHIVRKTYDKRLMHVLAEEAGVEYPRTHYPHHRADVEELACEFPVILKPAIKEGFNPLTVAKAWRVDTREQLLSLYGEACELMAPELVMVQELVPGGGACQLAYGALALGGQALASVMARRTRQYPMDFGRASTFVETVDMPEIAELAERLLARLGFTGLIEIEFKRDPRDGRCKLLDMNARPWGWHTLSARAGVDFPYLQWRLMQGQPVPEARARTNVSWMRLSTDLPTAVREILHGHLSVRDYLRAFRGPRESAIFALDDPLPGLCELPLLALLVGRRLVERRPV